MTTDASFLLSLSLPASLKTLCICVYIVIINKREKNKLKYGLNYPLQREKRMVFMIQGGIFPRRGSVRAACWLWKTLPVDRSGFQTWAAGQGGKQVEAGGGCTGENAGWGDWVGPWDPREVLVSREEWENWEAGDLRLAEDRMWCLLQPSSQARCLTVVMVEWGKLKVKVSWIEDVKKPLSQGIGCIIHSFEYWKHSVEGFWEKMSQLPMFLMNKKEQSWKWDRLPGTRSGRALVMSFKWWKNFTGGLWLINDLGWKEESRDGKAFFQLNSMVLRPWKSSI